MESQVELVEGSVQELKENIRSSERSKFKTYRDINLKMEKPDLYNLDIPEHMRIKVTRFRLSSHNLKIETGRWSRIPRDNRLCGCGEIQTERHVVEACCLTTHIRHKYGYTNVDAFSAIKCSNSSQVNFLVDIIDFFCKNG